MFQIKENRIAEDNEDDGGGCGDDDDGDEKVLPQPAAE